jgi:hypothetical protein
MYIEETMNLNTLPLGYNDKKKGIEGVEQCDTTVAL